MSEKTIREQATHIPDKVPPTKILIIDDDVRDRGLLVAVLEEEGYEVTCADNGRVGLMLCHQRTPDAVVLDLDMPELDGLSILRQLGILHPTLPVVVFSGRTPQEVEEETLNRGATAFIQKAFSLDLLGSALREVLPSPTQAKRISGD